ncbi:MAG: hypothetical protein ACRD1C_03170 [Terriglobales bacterium]
MKGKIALLAAAAFLLTAMPVLAGTITYNFGANGSSHDGELNTGASFGVSPYQITAYGFVGLTTDVASRNLYQKDDGSSEDGLGLNSTTDHEINPQQAIVFDVANLISAGYTGGTFTLGSLQSGEEGEVAGFNGISAGSLVVGSSYGDVSQYADGATTAGTGNIFVNWGSNPYVGFITDSHQSSSTGNFLVDGLTVTTTPEPATIFLLLPALLLLGWVGRRWWNGAPAA